MAKPDVRVRLTAEGVQEVVQALKKIQSEAQKTSDKSSKGFGKLNGVLGNMKGLLVGLGGYLSFRAFSGFLKAGSQAADQMGKLAIRIGTTVERASALSSVVRRSDGDMNSLVTLSSKLARNLILLSDGNQTAVESFGRLNLKAEDFAGLDTAEAIHLISTRLAAMEEGTAKSGIAVELLGKQGAKLLPAFNELGSKSLPEVVDQARALGHVLDQETVDAVIYMNDQLSDMKETATLLAANFVGGLAPAISQTLAQSRREMTKTQAQWKEAGQSAGRIVQGLVLVFGTLADIVISAFEVVGKALGTIAVYIGATVNAISRLIGGQGLGAALDEYKAATKAVVDEWENTKDNFAKRDEALYARFNALLEDIPKPELPEGREPLDLTPLEEQMQLRAQIARDGLQREVEITKAAGKLRNEQEKRAYEKGLLTIGEYYAARRKRIEAEAEIELGALKKQLDLLAEEGDPEKRQLEEQRLNAQLAKVRLDLQSELLKLREEEEKAVDDLAEKQLKAEELIREARGETHELRMEQIQRELDEYDLLLRKQGVGDAERARRLGEMGQVLESRAEFDRIASQAEQALDQIALARTQLEAEVAAGALTEMAAAEQLLQLEQERIPVLREIAEKMLLAAETTKDPALIAQAQEYAAAIRALGNSSSLASQKMAQWKDSVRSALTSDLSTWLSEGIEWTDNFRSAMTALGYSVVQSLRRIASEILATAAIARLSKIFGGGFSGGGQAGGKASGGLIRGPGTGTSDSIPAWLSTGEFVMRAAVVRQPGVLALLSALNKGLVRPNIARGGAMRGFAEGGLADRASTGIVGDSRLVVGLEPGLLLKSLETAEGQKLLVQLIGRNRRAIGRVVG